MTNTNETIADIIAEIRLLSNPISDGIIAIDGRSIANRLEAAWKREKSAIEADALAVGGMVEASRATAEKSSIVGNSVKLREALVGLIDGICFHCDLSEVCKGVPCEKMQKAKAALAEPVRNCDVARDWLHLYAHFKPPATVRREMKLAWYMLKGFVVGLLTSPIYALLYVYDMTYTFPHEAVKGGAK